MHIKPGSSFSNGDPVEMETGTQTPGGEKQKYQPLPQKVRLPQALSSFRHRNYQLWFGGQLISVVGTWMQIIAQSWLVYEISRSEFALGLVSFASAIPVLIVSPWGGVVTDQAPKRTVLLTTQSISMLLALILAALTFTHNVQVWHIILLAAILGTVNAFDSPARQSLVVDMVAREDLTNAIALNSAIFNGARVIGPAIGGLLLATLGASWCFLINGLSFLAVLGGLLAMHFPQVDLPSRRSRPWRQFIEGVRYARGHPYIFSLLAIAAIFSVFGAAYTAILPAFVDQVLHSGATGYGTINACIGVGAVGAALYLAQAGRSLKRGKVLMTASLVYPFILALFAFDPIFILSMVLAVGLGIGFMLLFNNLNSLLQLHVVDPMRGRVMSLYTISFMGLSPVGALGIGIVATYLPMTITIALSALLTLVLSLLVYRRSPRIKEL